MIAHVAEADENSGRVVLQMAAHCDVAPTALAAALRIARSFSAGLESLVAEDPELFDFAQFDFAREVTIGGGLPQKVQSGELEPLLQRLAVLRHGEVVAAARDVAVPVHCRTVRGDQAAAIAAACSENGPWNIAVLAEPVTAQTESHLAGLFSTIADVTGFVAAGRGARRTDGPVVAIVEQLAHAEPMLRAAERLAAGMGEDVHLILFGGNADDLAWMEGQVRLLLHGRDSAELILSPDTCASPEALASVLQDLGVGFVIAQLGGALLPAGGGLASFAKLHDGPLFLVR